VFEMKKKKGTVKFGKGFWEKDRRLLKAIKNVKDGKVGSRRLLPKKKRYSII